ncbi:MAG: lysophospholipase [Acidobacteriota bacterium]|nr:lysophospholipase [Acidobacteriota bacterium]
MLKRNLLYALPLFLLLGFLQIANAQQFVRPIELSGELDGAPYRIRVPRAWNGTLLLYAHGYRDKADHPGEVENRAADVAPSAALEPVLLAQGYALAGSAYRDNGWAVQEGIEDMKNLALFFRGRVRNPDNTILWGFSMGTVISFASMERYPELYDGALCACAVGAGSPQSWDSAGDLLLAYDQLFGVPQSWGTPGNVRNDLDFETEVLPKLTAEVGNQANFPKFEFIRLVTGTPGRGIMPPAPPAFYPGWVFTDMFFTTEARAELERRARGPIVQNVNRNYNLTAQEKAYLVSLGIPAPVIDDWLVALNAQRNIFAPYYSRFYLNRNAEYTGLIESPVLTLHTLYDPLVTVSQEREYAETVAAANRSNLLYQTYTNGNGHCNFTGEQLVTSVIAIDNWVVNGTRPTAANFPTALGFLPESFVPPPMNQP